MTEASDKSGGFAVSVDFYASHAVLGLRGVLDELALPGLSALLGAVIAGGYDTVTLDLSELDYMTSVGMRVIAEADRQVSDRRGRLTVRSPSAAVRHLLDANGLGQLASSPTREAAAHQGRSGAMPVAAGAAAYGLVHDLRRATAVPSNDDVIDNALRLVLAVARTTVDGADGVSIWLRRHGQLATVAASDQTISHMDASQYATGEGPCVAASVEGRGFLVDSLTSETRWPSFIPLARALGINAILSTPLTAADLPVGSINIYSRTVAAFDAQDRALVSVLAVEASAILTDAGLNLSDHRAVGAVPGRPLDPSGDRPGPRGPHGAIRYHRGQGVHDAPHPLAAHRAPPPPVGPGHHRLHPAPGGPDGACRPDRRWRTNGGHRHRRRHQRGPEREQGRGGRR